MIKFDPGSWLSSALFGASRDTKPLMKGADPTDSPKVIEVPSPKVELSFADRTVRNTQRISYGSSSLQYGVLGLPMGAGPHPVAVLVHGGFWRNRNGDPSDMADLAAFLEQRGIATWNLEYRALSAPAVGLFSDLLMSSQPKMGPSEVGGWPGTFTDVGQGLDHLRALAQTHPLDLSQIVVIGHSAGGQLALHMAHRPQLFDTSPLRGAEPLEVSAVVSLAGVNLMQEAAASGLGSGAAGQVVGGAPQAFPERYAQLDPGQFEQLQVPQLVVHGTKDEWVPSRMTTRYTERAKARGDRIEQVVLPGATHYQLLDPEDLAGRQVSARVLELFQSGQRS